MKCINIFIIINILFFCTTVFAKPLLSICQAVEIVEEKLEKDKGGSFFIQSISYIELSDNNYIWRAKYDTEIIIDKKDKNISIPVYKYVDVDMKGRAIYTTESGIKRIYVPSRAP